MKTRSRRTSPGLGRTLRLATAALLAFGPLGCARGTLPREHWWQIWRTKPTMTPADVVVLPPPPEVLGNTVRDGTRIEPPVPVVPTVTVETDALREAVTGTVSELQTIHFDYDSSELTGEAKAMLDQNGQWLLNHPSLQILIEGHCDERGSVEYNLNLGDRRAKSVRAYLTSKGVSGDSLHTMSYGEERPLDPTLTEEAYRKNRRAQFFVY
jgi:peptidoglycan-associated lipoprotein